MLQNILMLKDSNQFWINKIQYLTRNQSLTIRAADRQNAVPFALASAYSSYSASRKWRSAAAIAKSRGSFKSKAVSETAQPSLQTHLRNRKSKIRSNKLYSNSSKQDRGVQEAKVRMNITRNFRNYVLEIHEPKYTSLSQVNQNLPHINGGIFRSRGWYGQGITRLIILKTSELKY